jgi:Cu+-exporting ATPase
MKTQLQLGGMSCRNCAEHVTKALLRVDGVSEAVVDLDTGRAHVVHNGTPLAHLISAVEEEGYTAAAPVISG